MPQKSSSSLTTAQTDGILLDRPGVGKQYVVESLYLSSDTAQIVQVSSDGIVAVKEVTTVDIGTSTGGTFTLTFDGATTSALAWNAAAATVETAVEALSTVTTATVTGTGAVGTPWVITVDTPVQNFTVTGDGALLTGGDSTLTVTETTAGLKAGAARIINYTPANGSAVLNGRPGHLFTCSDNAALCWTTSATAKVFVSVQYRVSNTFDLSS